MQQITKRALELVEAFENQISALSVEERMLVLQRLTSHILALNEHVEEVWKVVPRPDYSADDSYSDNQKWEKDSDHIHDFI